MTNFLSLPLELRRQIYGYVLDEEYWLSSFSPQDGRGGGRPESFPIIHTCPRIRDEFLQFVYGKAKIKFRTIHLNDTETSVASFNSFAAFVKASKVRHFEQIKVLKFLYCDWHAGADDSSRNSQLLEALQYLVDCGCHLRTFTLVIQLGGSDNMFPDLDSWRTKLLGGTPVADALCALHVSNAIVIEMWESEPENKGMELIAKMVEEVALGKGWRSSPKEIDQGTRSKQYWMWILQPSKK